MSTLTANTAWGSREQRAFLPCIRKSPASASLRDNHKIMRFLKLGKQISDISHQIYRYKLQAGALFLSCMLGEHFDSVHMFMERKAWRSSDSPGRTLVIKASYFYLRDNNNNNINKYN